MTEAGFEIILISNQAGISKGYYTEEKLREITKRMLSELKKNSASLAGTYYCIHQDSDNCDCRKPKTGLFRQAVKELNFEISNNYFIGDGKTDIEAGHKIGLKTVLVLSGKTNLDSMRAWDIKPDFILDSIGDIKL